MSEDIDGSVVQSFSRSVVQGREAPHDAAVVAKDRVLQVGAAAHDEGARTHVGLVERLAMNSTPWPRP